MPFALFLPLVPLVAVILYAFVLFDRLVRAEYEAQRQIWEADGRPRGYFWRPAECGAFDIPAQFARVRLSIAWLFRTPAWIAESAAYSVWLRRHRVAVLIWNVGVLIWFVFFLRLT